MELFSFSFDFAIQILYIFQIIFVKFPQKPAINIFHFYYIF